MPEGVIRRLIGMFLSLPLVLAMMCLFAACGDEKEEDEPEGSDSMVIHDFRGTAITIKIVDEDGVNLLNPTVEGNWMNQPFTMVFEGKTYETDWTGHLDYTAIYREKPETPQSRFMPPMWCGLWCAKDRYWNGERWLIRPDCHMIQFGEFLTESDFDLTMSFIVPGMEQTLEIELTHRIIWDKEEAHITNRIVVNGQDVEAFPIKLVLPRLAADDSAGDTGTAD